jgi:hypothetical protein
MEKNKYLPVGSIIGGHYETVDLLGEDDFEILYLVRDNHRRGSFFVLKELFLETFSSRNEKSVYTIPQAQGVFDKRKREIILEIEQAKRSRQVDEIKTYGYIEDNNTIYTIMEFTNNSNLANYLQFKSNKDKMVLPSLEELVAPAKKEKSSFLFLKILIVTVVIGVALAIYANKLIQEDRKKAEAKTEVVVTQTPIHHPALTSRNEERPQQERVTTQEPKIKEPTSVPENAEYIPIKEIETTKNNDEDTIVPENDKIYIDNDSEEIIDEEEIVEEKPTPSSIKVAEPTTISLGTKIESVIDKKETKNPISLGERVETKKVEDFTRESIQKFLNDFIASSEHGSVDDIASKYDYHVDRYFSLKNVTHSMIKKDKRRYNKRWTHREFKIENFKILKIYKKDGTDFCDVKTTTKWRVSTDSGKRASGTSRGFMSIKKTDHGFKVKSIYTMR